MYKITSVKYVCCQPSLSSSLKYLLISFVNFHIIVDIFVVLFFILFQPSEADLLVLCGEFNFNLVSCWNKMLTETVRNIKIIRASREESKILSSIADQITFPIRCNILWDMISSWSPSNCRMLLPSKVSRYFQIF